MSRPPRASRPMHSGGGSVTFVQSHLAEALAPHLTKPAEAKRALRNLFAAPGRVRVSARAITIDLMPADTSSELAAFERLFVTVNA